MSIRFSLLAFALTVAGVGCSEDRRPSSVALAEEDSAAASLTAEHWGSQLVSPSRNEHYNALLNLGESGQQAIPYIPQIARFLESDIDSLGATAAWALAQVGPEGLPPLVRALGHSVARVRRRAAYGLGEAGDAAGSMVPELRRRVDQDQDVEVRRMAKWALDQIAYSASVPDPNLFLMEGLNATDLSVRLEAVRRLGASHPSDAVATSRLIRLLADSVAAVRNAAVDALVEKGSVAVPELTVALNSPRIRVRNGAMRALSRMNRHF
jgi:HEAT repeat protein